MTPDRKKILKRYRKFAALAGSPNVHEAARAREQAAALKKKHRITNAEIATAAKRDTPIVVAGTLDDWQSHIALAIGARFHCLVLSARGTFAFQGASAADATAYLHYVVGWIDGACAESWRLRRGQGYGTWDALERTWRIAFVTEAARALASRLRSVTEPEAPPPEEDIVEEASPSETSAPTDAPEAPEDENTVTAPPEIWIANDIAETSFHDSADLTSVVRSLLAYLRPRMGMSGARSYVASEVSQAAEGGRRAGEEVRLDAPRDRALT